MGTVPGILFRLNVPSAVRKYPEEFSTLHKRWIMTVSLQHVEPKELLPGFHGRFVHTEQATLAFWEIKAGAVLPEHSHFHEQTTYVMEGQFELTISGQTGVYQPGLVAVIPSHAMHSGRALTDCKVLDVFCPAREEYR